MSITNLPTSVSPARAAALVAFATLALAGCGGGGTKQTTSSATTTASPTTTAASPTTTGSAAAGGVSGSLIGALASTAGCASNADLASAFDAAIAGSGGSLSHSAALLQQFAARTPAAIRPDYELIAGAFAQVAANLKGYSLGSHGVPNAATLAKLEQVAAQVTSPALSKAVHAISAWAATHCKA